MSSLDFEVGKSMREIRICRCNCPSNALSPSPSQISFEGLPTESGWPTPTQLKKILLTRNGQPVSMQDIEADVVTLQATGLFKSVRPGAAQGGMDDAPQFGVAFSGEGGSAQLKTVLPLGGVRFTVVPRCR